ncbi:hypothetical protein E2C01_039513 [Portunus trituberculatus]|uniref:Uncharacterized protein n=1 Tax=Portunus trituberculatus TaxID=210409 RepID=A0A5B7FLK1_PORTR|nr:hypothetical protein [Portunus trituberculatus]
MSLGLQPRLQTSAAWRRCEGESFTCENSTLSHSPRCNRFSVRLEHLSANEDRLEGYLECFIEAN